MEFIQTYAYLNANPYKDRWVLVAAAVMSAAFTFIGMMVAM